jgi:carbamoyl-phosphate synthase/aspartate carbamoyltransferase
MGFGATPALMKLDDELQTPSDQRLFAIANAMHEGYSVDKIWEMTKIDKWFLRKLKGLSDFAKDMSNYSTTDITGSPHLLLQAKRLGFSDRQLANFWSSNEIAVRRLRQEAGIHPFVKQIDTVAAEFPAYTNYLYLTYNASEHDLDFDDHGVVVLGSGVYRIGSSVEFDWCSVRAIRTLRELGYKTVMINSRSPLSFILHIVFSFFILSIYFSFWVFVCCCRFVPIQVDITNPIICLIFILLHHGCLPDSLLLWAQQLVDLDSIGFQ